MKIAVIGSGISGLASAYLLDEAGNEVIIYEKNDYIGGHSRTVDARIDGESIPVDTGFIVFNYKNYPHLSALFQHLGVEVEKSNMSFGVNIANSWLEYGTQNLTDIFAQKRNLFKPKFWKMVKDILHFNKNAKKYIDSNLTLGECLDELKMGEWFRHYYLLAMGGSIWSTPTEGMLNFPASTFIRFFDNHGLLSVSDQPQWYTVKGGSKEYVKKLTKGFKDKIRLNCGVRSVARKNGTILVEDEKGNKESFEQVIFACHSDQAVDILSDASASEKEILGNFKYQGNKMILHTDEKFLPKNKKCWSSWVYLSEEKNDKSGNVCLSYWMNNLQNLGTITPVIVTLNPYKMPDKEKIIDEYIFEHPVFDKAAINAQAKISEIQGKNNTWFCGAYQRYGFHEDGVLSAVNLVRNLGATTPWK